MRRATPLVLAIAGCLLLGITEFMTLYEIKVITVTVADGTVGDHHGYALLIVAVVAAAMAWFSVVGGSRAAGFALLALSVVALVVVFAVDLPVVDDTGLWGERYERAAASAGTGFYLETLGAVLLLLGAVANLVLAPGSRAAEPRASRAPVSADPA